MLTDREWLRREYAERERTVADIAKELGVSAVTVWRGLDRAGIPRRPRGPLAATISAGDRCGRLVVVGLSRSRPAAKERYFDCVCDCGAQTVVASSALRSGRTRSCGCLGREHAAAACTSHGKSGTPAWASWSAMKKRCLNPNSPDFPAYGGRGIAPCARMRAFDGFYAVLGDRPEGKTVDRIDNDGGYWCGDCSECRGNGWPMNVRWATATEQANNRGRRLDGATGRPQ